MTDFRSDPQRLLLPPPRELQLLERPWRPPASIGIRASGIHARKVSPETPGLYWVDQALGRFGCRLSFRSGMQAGLLIREESNLPPDGYRLRVAGNGIVLGASSAAGAQNGLATLAQWLQLAPDAGPGGRVPGVLIEDRPEFAERGVMIDVARDKRPTLRVLKAFVEQLARWKFNRLQLYMEADFAYPGAEVALAGRSPYTAREMHELAQHAEKLHVTLVPNQQSFGHMHPWLRHERWRSLAEVPEGVEHPFSRVPEPFSLNPGDPRSLEFLADLYDTLLPSFRTDQVNVGLDETFDLGLGASKERCAREGKARVYLEFLRAVHGLLAARGKRMMYWGDIVLEHPELLGDLPPEATAMVWGYEASHPFEEQLARLQASGLPFQVCPGTSSWNSFGGRIHNAHGNLRRAAQAAREHGAEGLLICDWGDRGHLQPWPIAFFGWAYGSACAWNTSAAQQTPPQEVEAWLNRWAFPGCPLPVGTALGRLGSTAEAMGDGCENGTALFFGLVLPDDPLPNDRVKRFPLEALDAMEASLEGALELPGTTAPDPAGETLVERELTFARDALLAGTRFLRDRLQVDDGNWRRLPSQQLQAHRATLEGLRETHRQLWPERYRPGGLDASLTWLDPLGHDSPAP